MDIAGLQKLSADTLILIVGVLGFMTFGFATEEFEVTADRLRVYLPVEHIDNPKGYAEKEGDARQFHPMLRPPVDPRELEIDERTGMKKYMATEGHRWDTSTAHIRRTFQACIEHGRRAGGREGADLFEAYRLMGTGLHTLEDLLAHSNWCELALRKMGHEQVFCHVGDEVIIDTPNGPAPPLITGTFGSADFMHSMMGEATDHISQASVTDLSQKMDDASNSDQDSNVSKLKDLLSKIPLGGSDSSSQMNEAESLHQASKAYNFNPDDVAPKEVQQQLWALLKWRDGIYRSILEKIEMIPGLSDLIDGITDALNAYVYTILAPWLTPILKQATEVLGEGSKAVIDSEDQYELILNEPAGKVAQVVVRYAVNLLVKAWSDRNEDPDQVINQILEAFHHPYYSTGNSQIQHAMFDAMDQWIGGQGSEKEQILEALTKESVREGKNKRQGSDDETATSPGGAHSHSQGTYGSGQFTSGQNYSSSQGDGYNQSQRRGQGYGDESGGYGGSYSQQGPSYERRDQSSYGQSGDFGDGSGRSGYQPSYEGGRRIEQESGYSRRREEEPSYGRRKEEPKEPSYRRRAEEPPYGRREEPSYGRRQDDEGGYRPSYSDDRQEAYQRQPGYGGDSYGRSEPSEYEEPKHHAHHGHREEEGAYGGGYGQERQEFGGGGRQEYGGPRPEYGGPRSEPGGEEYGIDRQEYRGGREDHSGQRRGGYGGNEGRGGFGERSEEYGGYGREPESDNGGRGGDEGRHGYGEPRERYGGGGYRGGNDETFGAERLNLNAGEEGYNGQRDRYGRSQSRTSNEYQEGY
ncbi:hypothetical protein EW146_g1532 [Bondarzewia mesenterica]|uniref:Het-C-domain-containing protein n=1 Tax=Bondarzewia mesenterica TaxID=1095465 RepID=A0A4S4M5T3_9AGAM|nr:hypothetical protein EW146_g1532 [Bondarzewia mesenterica]